MADLRDRGQILLIAAFTLGIIFVALALVVNSAIFTENLASRGEVAGSTEALDYQHQVRQSVGEAMAFANVYNASDPDGSVKASLSDIGTIGGSQQSLGGQLVNVSWVGWDDGTRIADNASGGSEFRSTGGATYWELASGVDRVRDLRVTVTDPNDLETTGSEALRFVLNETGTNTSYWNATIRRNGAGDIAFVSVTTANGESATCEHDIGGVSEFEVDLTRGLVNGERCHALARDGESGTQMWLGTGISGTYALWIEHGDEVEGNYSMTLQGNENTSNLASSPAAGTPFETDAIYEATVDYVFVTQNVVYETELRIAPGEPP